MYYLMEKLRTFSRTDNDLYPEAFFWWLPEKEKRLLGLKCKMAIVSEWTWENLSSSEFEGLDFHFDNTMASL